MHSRLYGSRRVPLNLFPVPKAWFPVIEQALEIKLTQQQKKKLFYPETQMFGMRCGKTTIHCILVALSIGPPLKPEEASDYGDGKLNYKQHFFMKVYQEIATKLESAGFDVRQVGRVGGWKLKR
ncbi:hypothetical protein AAGS61_02905 [Lysinibacillus sp. KU-BSD001]|uniref:hypothetical protein n=1 Tax=Lysinibacillus sp. KU-BSD001 TaxID=3141328 RepID=UPI0036E1E6A7